MTAVLERLRMPRVFHRIALGRALSAQETAFGESWLRHHPGWQLRLWTDADVPPLRNQQLFDAAPAGQKADILRYELLLAHGGVFIGTDMECLRSIEPLLGGVEVFCVREDGFRLGDGVLGAAPGSPLIAAVVDALPNSIAWRAGKPRDEQTGAELLTRVVAEQDALGTVTPAVFGSELFFPYHWTETPREGTAFPDAYAVCHWLSAFPAAPAAAEPPAAAPPPPPPAPAPAPAVDRIVVTVDPDLVETAAVVLAGAVEIAIGRPGMELALVVKGVPQVTEAVGDAMSGLLQQLAGGRDLPEIVVYGEPEGATLHATMRVAMSDDPAENARTLLGLQSAPAPTPVAEAPVRAGLRGTYIGNNRMLIETAYGSMLLAPADDYSLMPSLVTWGAIEGPLTKFLAMTIQPGQTFVDIGANIGYFTVLATQRTGLGGKVIAFEANPTTAGILRDNLAVNWLTEHNVVVHNQAAYSANTTIKFHASAKWVGDSSIQHRPDHVNRVDEVTSMEVPAVRLDDALRDAGVIDVLKIDIEGGEYHAFMGMMDLIRQRRIRRIVFEWNSLMLGADRGRFADLLRTIGKECGGRLHALSADIRPTPIDVSDLERVDFYPFAIIDF
ncbi:FkbM family methyltransferase [Dactylosporangium vinaceum]|uniref:FkbM family methyltransferase n=1 Tax=Dactylosporangium vinaceum TaxID=53362 RepID=A0ABV5MLB4_9ACTN|nr:FkbM family methyltransferase [Dactylosporangium vinaceum]UAB95480.1 FkbM family methyltransferase [Dactylosporangium vinaceum]